jgi:hypothetical protein
VKVAVHPLTPERWTAPETGFVEVVRRRPARPAAGLALPAD